MHIYPPPHQTLGKLGSHRSLGELEAEEAYKQKRIAKQTEKCDRKIENWQTRYDNLLERVRLLMLDADQKRTQCTDVGTFRYQKGRETVSTVNWDALSSEQQDLVIRQEPSLFRAVYSLHKKTIAARLKQEPPNSSVFTLETAPDKFVFKPE